MWCAFFFYIHFPSSNSVRFASFLKYKKSKPFVAGAYHRICVYIRYIRSDSFVDPCLIKYFVLFFCDGVIFSFQYNSTILLTTSNNIHLNTFLRESAVSIVPFIIYYILLKLFSLFLSLCLSFSSFSPFHYFILSFRIPLLRVISCSLFLRLQCDVR